MININVSNNIQLNGLPKEIYYRLVQRLTHLNPNYENAMRYSKNKYKAKRIPKTIKAYQYDKQKKQLIIPRGFYLELRSILDEENLEYRVIENFPNYERIETESNIELRPYQQEMINDLECYYGYNCIAKAPPGSGKCASKDTLVKTDLGWKYIQDIEVNDVVKTFTGYEKVSKHYSLGRSKTLKIEANNVYGIECTPEHPLLGVKEGTLCWVKAEELSIGDYVLLGRENDTYIRRERDPLARLFGYLIADGVIGTKKHLLFTNDNPFIIDDFRQVLKDLDITWIERPNNDKGSITFSLHKPQTLKNNWNINYGLRLVKSKDKEIPSYVMVDKNKSIEFLSAYLSCESCCGGYGLSFSSVSKKLINQICTLLLSFGIACFGRKDYERSNIYNGKLIKLTDCVYEATVVATSLIVLLRFDLPTIWINRISSILPKRTSSNMDIVPLYKEISESHNRLKNNGYGYCKKSYENNGVYEHGVYRYRKGIVSPSFPMLTKLISSFGENCSPLLKDVNKSKPFFAKITSIEESENEVFDLTVEKEHHYLGSGFYSHNTVLGLEFARRQGYPCLWMVHNDRLFKQAINTAELIFNQSEDEVGIIRGKDTKIGKNITVGMFQTLMRRDIIGENLNTKFGTIIVDETHHSPSNSWSYIINCFNPYLVLGLTATPRRGDGLTQLLFDYMGPIVTTASKERLFEAGFAVPVEYHTLYSDIHTYGDNFKQIETHMIGIPERNELLFRIIQQEYGEQDNYIVLLTSRRDHVATMHEMCLERRIPALKLLGGKLKKEEEARIEQELDNQRCRLLIATYSYLSEGFDYPPLSTVIFATPFRDDVRLEQSVGRAQRYTKTKTHAKIIDITDDNSMLKSQSRDRLEYAELLELDVRKYDLAT